MKTIFLKTFLIISLFLLKFIFLFLPKKIDDNRNSNLRVFIINKLCEIQNLMLKKINYPLNLYRTKDQNLYAEVGGILLDTSYTYRYFKLTDNVKIKNQGEGYEFFFVKTKKKNFFDLGSHIGEISLYLAKNYPHTQIISVEGSPTCFKIQKRNISINKFKNIKLFNLALSNKNSQEYTSDYFGTENYTIDFPKKGFIKIQSTTLTQLLKKTKFEFIDFLKIDIEGSIPKLTDDLIELWENGRIQFCALSFEKNSYESYEKIINSLTKNSKMYIFDPNFDLRKEISSSFLKKSLKIKLGNHYQSNRFQGMEIVFERHL